jgi:hypothetical protein
MSKLKKLTNAYGKLGNLRGYTIGYSAFAKSFIYLSICVLGHERQALCPYCYNATLNWLNWNMSKETDEDLFAKCECGKTIHEQNILVGEIAEK